MVISASTVPDNGDELAIYDFSLGATRKMTRSDFLKGMSAVFEQSTLASLGIGATWNIIHTADCAVTRLIQIFLGITVSDESLMFTLANEASFTQEDISKTEFITNHVELERTIVDPDILHLWEFGK